MRLFSCIIVTFLMSISLSPASIAQSGGTIFQDYCSTCHSSDLVSDNIITGSAIAPALAPYVERFDAAVFVTNIRNDRLLADPMRTFEGELSDAELRRVWQYITDVSRGETARIPRGETQEQRIKRQKCEAIKTRMNTPPPGPPGYYPPGHDRCTCGESGESFCNQEGTFGERIVPLTPVTYRYCKPWVWQSERDYYGNHCRTVQMVGDAAMNIPPPPLPQAPDKLKRAMKEQPFKDVLNRRSLQMQVPKPPVLPAQAEPEGPGPVPASAELRCRAGGNMRLEATRPTRMDWVPRWDRQRGVEIERGNGKPDMVDEHWAFIVYATLAPVGASRPPAGQCIWTSPNAHGLQLNKQNPLAIAIDMRVLSDDFPFERMTVQSGGRISLKTSNRNGISPEQPRRAAIEALAAILSGTGEFTARVMPSEKPAPFKGARVEHVGNNTLAFREPPTAREIGPY